MRVTGKEPKNQYFSFILFIWSILLCLLLPCQKKKREKKRENIPPTLGFFLPSNLPAGYSVGCNWGSTYGWVISQLPCGMSQPWLHHKLHQKLLPPTSRRRGLLQTTSLMIQAMWDWEAESLNPTRCVAAASQKYSGHWWMIARTRGSQCVNMASPNPFWHNLCPSTSPLLLLQEAGHMAQNVYLRSRKCINMIL